MANQTRLNGEAISWQVRTSGWCSTVLRVAALFRSEHKTRTCRDLFERNALSYPGPSNFQYIVPREHNGPLNMAFSASYFCRENYQVCGCFQLAIKRHVICCCCVSLKCGIRSCTGQGTFAQIPCIVLRLITSCKKVNCLLSSSQEFLLGGCSPRKMTHVGWGAFMQSKYQILIGYALQQPPVLLGTTVQPPAPILALPPG